MSVAIPSAIEPAGEALPQRLPKDVKRSVTAGEGFKLRVSSPVRSEPLPVKAAMLLAPIKKVAARSADRAAQAEDAALVGTIVPLWMVWMVAVSMARFALRPAVNAPSPGLFPARAITSAANPTTLAIATRLARTSA
ncbi:hypothetical protein FRC01_001553 [Tulasnella sp. 417]|nr:hypothetical protein FRC01_001553 [Tulasnella sp. 417]